MPRKALNRFSERLSSEMTNQEIDRQLQQAGCPPTPLNGSRDQMAQWAVAAIFILYLQEALDSKSAAIRAANDCLASRDYIEKLPYVEMAFGRKLTSEEILARRINVSGRF